MFVVDHDGIHEGWGSAFPARRRKASSEAEPLQPEGTSLEVRYLIMLVSLGCPSSGSRTWGSEGGDGVSSSYLIHSTQPALVSISSDGGPCTGRERALGFISSSRGGGAQSLVRGASKGEKGLKVRQHSSNQNRARGVFREREGRGRAPLLERE